jgi:hypothetical protein
MRQELSETPLRNNFPGTPHTMHGVANGCDGSTRDQANGFPFRSTMWFGKTEGRAEIVNNLWGRRSRCITNNVTFPQAQGEHQERAVDYLNRGCEVISLRSDE